MKCLSKNALLVLIVSIATRGALCRCEHRKEHHTSCQLPDPEPEDNPQLQTDEQPVRELPKAAASSRRSLAARATKLNPYGARYELRADQSAGMPQRELAEGLAASTTKEKRRKERRKTLNRLAKRNTLEPNSSLSQVELPSTREMDLTKPAVVAGHHLDSSSQALPAGFDSSAVGDHASKDDIAAQPQGGSNRARARASAGEGQLGLGGAEAAGGVDSTGVSEHFREDADLLEGHPLENGTRLDATGAQMPKRSKAAGVDSEGAAEHISEDVGQDLVYKSGSAAELSQLQTHPRDASDREVVSSGKAVEREGASFNQLVISEAAEDAVADAEDNGEVDISAAGVMPSDWKADPSKNSRNSELRGGALNPA